MIQSDAPVTDGTLDVPIGAGDFGAPSFRLLVPDLIWNFVLPYALYKTLWLTGISLVVALAASCVFPVFKIVWDWAKFRRINPIAGASLVFIVFGVTASLMSGNARFTLVRESSFTGAFALAFLGSLFAARPLTFYFGRQFAAAGDAERMEAYDSMWEIPEVRHGHGVVTVTWGIVLLFDAIVRIYFALTINPSTVASYSPFFSLAIFAGLFAWTNRYVRRRVEADTPQVVQRMMEGTPS